MHRLPLRQLFANDVSHLRMHFEHNGRGRVLQFAKRITKNAACQKVWRQVADNLPECRCHNIGQTRFGFPVQALLALVRTRHIRQCLRHAGRVAIPFGFLADRAQLFHELPATAAPVAGVIAKPVLVGHEFARSSRVQNTLTIAVETTFDRVSHSFAPN